MMRQQMGGAGSAGPRKLDSLDKKNYKELASTQAATAKDKVKEVNEKAKARNTDSARPKNGGASGGDGFANWRTGNFGAAPAQVQVSQSTTNLGDNGLEEIGANNTQQKRKNSARRANNGNGGKAQNPGYVEEQMQK